MENNKISIVSLLIGALFLSLAIAYRLFITSDIPVSYTISEAINVQTLLFISIVLLLIGSLLNSNKRIQKTLMALFILIAIFHMADFQRSKLAEYFTSSYAQLTLSFVFQPMLILLINLWLFIKAEKTR